MSDDYGYMFKVYAENPETGELKNPFQMKAPTHKLGTTYTDYPDEHELYDNDKRYSFYKSRLLARDNNDWNHHDTSSKTHPFYKDGSQLFLSTEGNKNRYNRPLSSIGSYNKGASYTENNPHQGYSGIGLIDPVYSVFSLSDIANCIRHSDSKDISSIINNTPEWLKKRILRTADKFDRYTFSDYIADIRPYISHISSDGRYYFAPFINRHALLGNGQYHPTFKQATLHEIAGDMSYNDLYRLIDR